MAELEQLRREQSGPTIGPANPNAARVEVPESRNLAYLLGQKAIGKRLENLAQRKPAGMHDPNEDVYLQGMLGASTGATGHMPSPLEPGATLGKMSPVLENAARGVGRGARSLVDFIGGKLAGLSPAEVSAYQSAPTTVSALARSPELRQQQFAESALKSTSNRLGNRAGDLETVLNTQLGGKAAPESAFSEATKYGPKKSQDFINNSLKQAGYGPSFMGIPYEQLPAHAQQAIPEQEVPLTRVYAGAREAGKASRFAPGPIDPLADKARAEAAGKEFGVLRNVIATRAPEAEPTIEGLKQGIEAQQGLKRGATSPLSFMGGKTGDTAAARQAADQTVGGTRLERTAGQLQAAKALNSDSSHITEKLLRPVGRAILKTTQAAAKPASKLADFLGDVRPPAPSWRPGAAQSSELSPEDRADLERLRKEQGQ
jgi:hypothetical protein